jgi:hypothetical protein
VRVEAYLGGFAIEIGERFVLDVDLWRFYGRVPRGRGDREWLIDFTGHFRPCWDKIEPDPRPKSRLRPAGVLTVMEPRGHQCTASGAFQEQAGGHQGGAEGALGGEREGPARRILRDETVGARAK